MKIALQVRNLIVRDCEKGFSYRKIAKKFRVSFSAVRYIWKNYQQLGSVADKAGRGRKRLTTPRDDARIAREVHKNSKITSRAIKENLLLNVSARTVRRRLQEQEFKNKFAVRRPWISKRNRVKRLQFAKKHADNPIAFWKRVLWSDESKFEIFGTKQRSRVWVKPGEDLLDKNIKKTVKHGGGNIMVWGCFAWSGVGELAQIDGIMNADKYIDILSENLEPSVLKIGLENGFLFQQDNDPKHTARKTQKFFRGSRIKVLEWPPQSPDLNPIENLWSILDAKLDKSNVTNKYRLFEALQMAWESIDQSYLQNLVESMPRRLGAVIRANGGHTKY